MRNVGKKIAKWVDSQKGVAEEIGVSVSSMNSMLTGKMKLPLPRFLQIAYHLNPPQEEISEIFNLYLEDLELPLDGLKLIHKEVTEAGKGEVSISVDNKINKIIDAVMTSDLSDEAKVKVYNIVKSVKGR